MSHWRTLPLGAALIGGLILATGTPEAREGSRPPTAWQNKVDPWVLANAARDEAEFLVILREQADLAAAASLPTKAEKGAWVFRQLRDLAEATQPPVRAALNARGVKHESYWVANMIAVKGGLDTVAAMAQRSDVARVSANPRVHFSEPVMQVSERVFETFRRRVGRAADSCSPGLGARLHRPEHRHRRPGHRLPVGSSRAHQ